MKIQVVCLNRLVFLPYIHGLLRGYIEECEPELASTLEWSDPIFLDEPAETIAERIDTDILALSCYVWNFNKQMKIAKLVAKKNPYVYVVAGGPHIPNNPDGFFDEHPYVDVIVHGEGEITFANILKLHNKDCDAYHLAGTSTVGFHHPSESLFGEKLPKDIHLPSAYYAGYLDSAVKQARESGQEFWVSWETNRGCPFSCSFCFATNARVYTNNGAITIEEAVSFDDVTHVWSSHGMQPIARKIKRHYSGEMVVVKPHGRPEIRCTPEHEWLTDTGWKCAFQITKRDMLVSSDIQEKNVPVQCVKTEYYDGDVFNLEVDGQPVYSVHGLEVHNCDWGSSLLNKVRKFSLERLGHDIDYFGTNKIENVYICDANFGMLQVDEGITNALVESKQTTGYPKQIRGSFAKNSNDRVFNITKSLMESGMIYGTTLSMQSLDDNVLASVDRKNIGVEKYKELQARYAAEGYHTYTELILGLPGETKDTFIDGISDLIEAGNHEDIRVWELSILPNAPMAQHIDRYGLKTVTKNVFLESPRTDPDEIETNQIVIETDTMSKQDWVYSYLFAWVVQALHCGYYTRYIAEYLHRTKGISYRSFYENLINDAMLFDNHVFGRRLKKLESLLYTYPDKPNNHLTQKVPMYGTTRRNPADWLWLGLCSNKEYFYDYLQNYIHKIEWNAEVINLITFQEEIMLSPFYNPKYGKLINTRYDWVSYFNGGKLKKKATTYYVKQTHTGVDDKYPLGGNRKEFADAAVGSGFLVSRYRHYAHPFSELKTAR